jgi:nucleotide-binding universal stress UspA family protein
MNRILVGLDGSSRAPEVLGTAVRVARAQGAKLLLVRAIAIPSEVPKDFWKTTDEPLVDLLRRHCDDYLEEQAAYVNKLAEGVLEKTEVRVGVPWEALCTVAREERADLVVIGSHGYSGLDRLLGTTAARVVNHAPCSVLVVRTPQAG